MRNAIAATLAALAVLAGVAACAQGSPTATASADASVSAGGGAVGASAFGGHGRLAFVSADRLYVLDGSAAGRPAARHEVSTGNTAGKAAGSPAWSPDGRWLAFLVGTPSADGAVTSGALWLAGPDGQGAHQVLPAVAGFAWSPTTDEVAATSGLGGKVFAVRPGQPIYPMLEVPGLFNGAPAWSPNGRELAVATVTVTAKKRFAGSAIYLFVPGEGIMVNDFASSRTSAFIIDGWWITSEGLLAWSDPRDSAQAAANGLPLVSYPLGSGRIATLATTLAYPSFAVPAPGAANGLTLVTGGDRYLWSDRTIESCAVSGACGPAMDATPPPVNLDPAAIWAHGEPALAFVHGASAQTARLWTWIGAGANPFPIDRAGTGVAAPTWSANTQDILYVRGNALWLIAISNAHRYPPTAPAVRVVSRLFAGTAPNVNGYTAWRSQFAWHSQPA